MSTTEPGSERLSQDDVLDLTRHLSRLTADGLPLASGLSALAEDLPNGPLRRLLGAMANRLERGESLEVVLDHYQNRLPLHVRGLVAAGLRTGTIGVILEQYADHCQRSSELRRRIWLSLAYPTVLCIVASGLFAFVMLGIVPRFKEIYADFGIELPGITLAFLNLSDLFVKVGLPLLAVAFAVIALVWVAMSFGVFRHLVVWIPIIGPTRRLSALAEFLRLVGLLVGHGVPLPLALGLVSKGVPNRWVADFADAVAKRIEAGSSVAEALAERISASWYHLFDWCEDKNALAPTLIAVSDMLEGRVRTQSTLLRTAVPPLFFILFSSMVAWLVLALFAPLIKLINELGK